MNEEEMREYFHFNYMLSQLLKDKLNITIDVDTHRGRIIVGVKYDGIDICDSSVSIDKLEPGYE